MQIPKFTSILHMSVISRKREIASFTSNQIKARNRISRLKLFAIELVSYQPYNELIYKTRLSLENHAVDTNFTLLIPN